MSTNNTTAWPAVEPTQPPPPKQHRVRNTLVLTGVFVGGILIGAASGSKQTATTTAAPTPPPVTVTAEAPPAAATPPPVTVTAQPPANPPAAAPGVPQDGMNLVGTDVAPGTYRSQGATCYWERLSGTSGQLTDIIANNMPQGGAVVVTIAPTDVAFKSERCAPWASVG